MNADTSPIMHPPFDLTQSPLAGTCLIEAGAGTGKTYTITGIVLRLIIEQGIPISQILVVTFTEAATEELKSRIRDRLKEALAVFRGQETTDDTLKRLAEKWRKDSETEQAEAVQAVTEAIRDFDEAAIFTIHGFCHRVLRENAFESGMLFDTELTTDQDRISAAAVEDYWRTRLYTADPVFVRYLIDRTSPAELSALLKSHVSQPDIVVIPAGEAPDADSCETEFKKAYGALRAGWKQGKNEVGTLLRNDAGLNRNSYNVNSVPAWLDSMDLYLRPEIPHPVLPPKFEKFTPACLSKGTKKASSPPVHPFFDLCRKYQDRHAVLIKLYERKLIHFKRDLFTYAKSHIRKRKIQGNIQSFDDLLANMSAALEAPGGSLLAESIRSRYQAALIDEFQDTDPVQYHIFQTLFGASRHLLFLIGDPKQAIYSFRGADIFAYMTAAEQAAARYTLKTNWRSDPELIAAVNAVFDLRTRAFVYEEIPFGSACAPKDKPAGKEFRIDGASPPPFILWRLAQASATDTRKTVNRATAAEISRLLDLGRKGKAVIGEIPLTPGDIAVLTRTNREASEMQTTLTTIGIPSVICSTGDVFDTREASDTAKILAAIAWPGNDRRIRAALVSDMMGVCGESLADAAANESRWVAWLGRFALYHRLWHERGFIRMFREFLIEESVLPRLMALSDGERRCTNTLHLGELLHQASLARNMTPTRLTTWFFEQRFHADARLEEHPLRLESDENAVKLVTIHKSKGLEYPVVFCPFAWAPSRLKSNEVKKGVLFHDEANRRCLTRDLGSEHIARHLSSAEKEALAESLRLLYVSLTRAKHRCYLAWGPVNAAGTSAPSYLFHGRDEDAAEADLPGTLERRFNAMEEIDWEEDLEAIAKRSAGAIQVLPVPDDRGIRYSPYAGKTIALHVRRFKGSIPSGAGIASFSSIISSGISSGISPGISSGMASGISAGGSAASGFSILSGRPETSGLSGVPRRTGALHDPAELADHDDLPVIPDIPEGEGQPDIPSLIFAENLPADLPSERESLLREERSIFTFPRGARAGVCLHEIFEHTDFRQTRPRDSSPRIQDTLRKYRIDDVWAPVVAEMIRKVARFVLVSEEEDDGTRSISGTHPKHSGFSLSALSLKQRIDEMAFYFPLTSISSRHLETVFAAHGIGGPAGDFSERIGRLEFSRTRGMMKGFIDLVFEYGGRFYIVDWKSNHLGNRPEDYRPEILREVMADAFYILQYHLYTLALHRYLKHRLPGYDYESHFGGVRYLFVRGIDPDGSRTFGLFEDRPSAAAVQSLEALLVDETHVGSK